MAGANQYQIQNPGLHTQVVTSQLDSTQYLLQQATGILLSPIYTLVKQVLLRPPMHPIYLMSVVLVVSQMEVVVLGVSERDDGNDGVNEG